MVHKNRNFSGLQDTQQNSREMCEDPHESVIVTKQLMEKRLMKNGN